MGRKIEAAGVEPRRGVAAGPLVEVGDYFTDGRQLVEVNDLDADVALVRDARWSLLLGEVPVVLRIAVEDLIAGPRWRRVVPRGSA